VDDGSAVLSEECGAYGAATTVPELKTFKPERNPKLGMLFVLAMFYNSRFMRDFLNVQK
jgi:hypothetical protein